MLSAFSFVDPVAGPSGRRQRLDDLPPMRLSDGAWQGREGCALLTVSRRTRTPCSPNLSSLTCRGRPNLPLEPQNSDRRSALRQSAADLGGFPGNPHVLEEIGEAGKKTRRGEKAALCLFLSSARHSASARPRQPPQKCGRAMFDPSDASLTRSPKSPENLRFEAKFLWEPRGFYDSVRGGGYDDAPRRRERLFLVEEAGAGEPWARCRPTPRAGSGRRR